MREMIRPFRSLFSPLVLLALWQMVAASDLVPKKFFPGLPEIASRRGTDAPLRRMIQGEALTLGRAIIGLVLASVIGVVLAILSNVSPFFDRGFRVVASFLQPIPPAAVVPMAIFMLGLGVELYVFIIVLVAVWSPYLNGVMALNAVPREQILTARMLNLSPLAILFRVKFPSAMPQIFAGFVMRRPSA